MQLLRAGTVGVATSDHAGTAGTAGTGGQERTIEAHAFAGQLVDTGRSNSFVPVCSAIVPSHIVGNQEDDIGRCSSLGKFGRQQS